MNTLAEVTAVLATCTAPDVPVESITAEATLASLGIDSLDRIEIAMTIENRHGIEIAHAEAEACVTVGGLVALLDSKINAKQAAV